MRKLTRKHYAGWLPGRPMRQDRTRQGSRLLRPFQTNTPMKKHAITESCLSGVFARYFDFCGIDFNTCNSLVIYGILRLLPEKFITSIITSLTMAFHRNRQIASIEEGGTFAGEGRRLLEGVSLPEKLQLFLNQDVLRFIK